jgi:hypothetical protein
MANVQLPPIHSRNFKHKFKKTVVDSHIHILTKCMVQEAKSPLKNLVRHHCMEGFNSGVKGLIVSFSYSFSLYHVPRDLSEE